MSYSFHIISLFGDLMEPYLNGSILGRARRAGIIEVGYTNPRDFTTDVHRTVDDSPYGGGAGLLMMAEPLGQAIDLVREQHKPAKTVLLSATGRPFDQQVAIAQQRDQHPVYEVRLPNDQAGSVCLKLL